MGFAVLPMLVPEITPVYDVYFEAFKNAQIMEFLFPGGVDRQAHKHGTTLWLHHDQNGYTIKCVDSETGTIVGMAQWEVFWRPDKGSLWKKPKGAEWLKGDKRKKAETVLVPNWAMRDKLFGGRRHVCRWPEIGTSIYILTRTQIASQWLRIPSTSTKALVDCYFSGVLTLQSNWVFPSILNHPTWHYRCLKRQDSRG